MQKERLPTHSLRFFNHHPKPIWDGGPWWELGLGIDPTDAVTSPELATVGRKAQAQDSGSHGLGDKPPGKAWLSELQDSCLKGGKWGAAPRPSPAGFVCRTAS